MCDHRLVQAQRGVVDDVEIRLVPQRDSAAIGKPRDPRGHRRNHPNRVRNTQPSCGTVAGPVRQQERRIACIANHSVMRTAVAQAEHHVITANQIADRVKRVVLIVTHRDEQHRVSLFVEEAVVCLLHRGDTACRRARRDRRRGVRVVVGLIGQREDPVPRLCQEHQRMALHGGPVGEDPGAHLGPAHLGDPFG